jgi:glycosyltransferase involved in cell wall biosynthesis
LPSYSEGLPITILEAMATGLPIIASSVGSIPEVIQDGKNGFLIEAGDYKALAEKIKLLIRNKDLRQQMAINNVKKIAANYDKNVVLLQLRNEYDKLLEKATA